MSIDVNGIDKLQRKLFEIQKVLPEVLTSVSPEFGAYMRYSGFLEDGTRRMPPRPHIRPAIFGNADFIVSSLRTEVTKALANYGKSGNFPSKKAIIRMWVRILNDKPRRNAVNSAIAQQVWEFGFHIRSIRGFGDKRSISEVKREQEIKNAERKTRRKSGVKPRQPRKRGDGT